MLDKVHLQFDGKGKISRLQKIMFVSKQLIVNSAAYLPWGGASFHEAA
jgi:hypothetical protein